MLCNANLWRFRAVSQRLACLTRRGEEGKVKQWGALGSFCSQFVCFLLAASLGKWTAALLNPFFTKWSQFVWQDWNDKTTCGLKGHRHLLAIPQHLPHSPYLPSIVRATSHWGCFAKTTPKEVLKCLFTMAQCERLGTFCSWCFTWIFQHFPLSLNWLPNSLKSSFI